MLDYTKEHFIRKSLKPVITISLIAGIIIASYYLIHSHIVNQIFPIIYFFISILFSAIVTFALFLINMSIARFLETRLPWRKQFVKRLIMEILITNLIAIAVISIILTITLYILGDPGSDGNMLTAYVEDAAQAVLFNTIAMITVEFGVVTTQWKESILRTERLEKENILSQFEALKHQLNPHFMFNSLNALSSLIDDDPIKAKKFLGMFSKIYRYILDVKDKLVVELSEELEFLNSYIFMQQIRYHENLKVHIKIDSKNLRKFIPPLSIQLLVENAIKHNEISEENPLYINIADETDKITIRNNIKFREFQTDKSGIGLENLRKRIKFISDKEPEFYSENNEYIARIPFIDIDE